MEGPFVQHPLSTHQALLQLLSSMILWLLASLVVGLLANRLPAAWLERPRGQGPSHASICRSVCHSTALPAQPDSRPVPRHPPGPPGIRVWKRWIPDAGDALPGGVSKASLVRRDPHALRRLLQETRRAELVHWLLLPCGLLTVLWMPPAGVLVNVVFAMAFNLPCLLLQRYNRRRLQRLLNRFALQGT